MNIQTIIDISKTKSSENTLTNIVFNEELNLNIYPNSIEQKDGAVFFIAKEESKKFLFIMSNNVSKIMPKFEGQIVLEKNDIIIKRCLLTTSNRKSLQSIFSFTISSILGIKDSFGLGDRLGFANAGHIRALEGSAFKPILAQQSIRELTRTLRTADEVMDAAVWAVFQEGYKGGFGSDADHLKSTADIDLTLKAGFTMFTFDPSEHVDNEADIYSDEKLKEVVVNLPWSELFDVFDNAKERYANKSFKIADDLILNVTENEFYRAYAKYGKSIAHIKKMYEYLKNSSKDSKFEVEVSVDETESVTSIFEHFFFANELHRLKVEFISLAPRFVGAFEKGIDYKGDLELFKTEYEKHLAVTKYFGNYKISLHSGSDKFSVYKVIGSIKGAHTHVKTAGTSYLEALRVVAAMNPALFREILAFCIGLYEIEKKSYHVSADINKLKPVLEYSNDELLNLFQSTDARQVLHVTFGRVLTEKNETGYIFKEKILSCLADNESTHYEFLIKHFKKHLEPFE